MLIPASPMVLWDYCAQRCALIHDLTPRKLFATYKQTPHEYQFGIQGDLSNLCNFGWYDWCYHRNGSNNSFPRQKELLGRVLGPSKNEGNKIAQNVLNINGNIVPLRRVRQLTSLEKESNTEIIKRNEFDQIITTKLGNSLILPQKTTKEPHEGLDPGEIGYDNILDNLDKNMEHMDENGIHLQHSVIDKLIHAEVLLPNHGQLHRATVKRQHTNEDGETTGQYNDNPSLNNVIYDVEFSDGTVNEYCANVIAQNLYNIVEDSNTESRSLEAILDHDSSIDSKHKTKKYIVTKSGQKRERKSTAGWKILICWNDGGEKWVTLRKMNETYPVQMAQYAA